MRHAHARREPGWNLFIELLRQQDVEHFARRGRRSCTSLLDCAHDDRQIAGSGGVVQPLFERLFVLDPAPNLDSLRTELAHRLRYGVASDQRDQCVRGKIAGARNHQPQQGVDTHSLANPVVQRRIAVRADIQGVGRAVHQRSELIHHQQPLIHPKRAGVRAAEQLDHHRNFHRAGRVKARVRIQKKRVGASRIQISEPHKRPRILGDASLDFLQQRILTLRRDD